MKNVKEELIIDGELDIESLEEFPSYVPLGEAVLQTLRKAILDGSLKPGQLLSENKISSKLSVSRTPIREALRFLEKENLVSVLPGRRVIVSIPTVREIEEIYQIRLIIETEALRLISHSNDTIIQQLETCLKTAETQLNDPIHLGKANSNFHSILTSSLDNSRLEQFLDSLQYTINRFRYYSLKNDQWAKDSENEHWEIIKYLKNNQTEEAIKVLRKHLLTAQKVLVLFISENFK
ncbi:GntR family transcriptional regulator [Bacillus sp. Marseille-Q3570]|uniref:GntR family transcriptional regulator n=1 Tax=Bacillus sp. Marseille-Q3570 TaxID=2963522 RepID=UPI0021B72FDD|nr:GntR family transcriptional regulator [Bacillus sp. Marseille-Q3570]